mgnify:FL=1
MNKIFTHLSILFCCIYLASCTSLSQQRNAPIHQYVQPFIGKTVTDIQQQFDLKEIGIQPKKTAVQKENQLIYVFERDVSTSMPSGVSVPDQHGKWLPTQTGSTANSYKNLMSCNIIFNIENGIAKSYQLKGRAC